MLKNGSYQFDHFCFCLKAMKTFLVLLVIHIVCVVLLGLSIHRTAPSNNEFYTGQCQHIYDDDDKASADCHLDDFPNVEKGTVYQTQVIQTANFHVWSNLSIWMQSSNRYCNHLKHIETGMVQDAEDYINLFEINTSYYFVTTFTEMVDDACNPDNNPDASLYGGLVAMIVISAFWLIGLGFVQAVLWLDASFKPGEWASFVITGSVIWGLLTIGLWLIATYSRCALVDGECRIAGTGLSLSQRTGVFQNLSCSNDQCKITWGLQGADQLENPYGTCEEVTNVNTTSLPSTRTLVLNPSNKVECRSLPSTWVPLGYVALLVFLTAPLLLAVDTGCYFCKKRCKRVKCRISWDQEQEQEGHVNASSHLLSEY
jgi:hypothetical protein